MPSRLPPEQTKKTGRIAPQNADSPKCRNLELSSSTLTCVWYVRALSERNNRMYDDTMEEGKKSYRQSAGNAEERTFVRRTQQQSSPRLRRWGGRRVLEKGGTRNEERALVCCAHTLARGRRHIDPLIRRRSLTRSQPTVIGSSVTHPS